MHVKTDVIKAVLLAAGKKDVRYYLNGVHINSTHIVGTDGERIHIARHGGFWGNAQTIPRVAVEAALKLAGPEIEITATHIGNVAYTPIDGRYPDYVRVMWHPGVASLAQGAALPPNPKLLADAEKAVFLASNKLGVLVDVGGRYVWSNEQFQALVMCRRKTEKGDPTSTSGVP